MSIERIKKTIREIPDYPKPGILFYDITPILKEPEIFNMVIDMLAEPYRDNLPDKILGIESRGFIFGMPLAYKLGIGFVPVRKKGKLPYKTYETSYDLEYGSATIEMHQDALKEREKVLIIDDLLATGGTAAASVELAKKFKADVLAVDFVIELACLNGREKLKGVNINSLITY